FPGGRVTGVERLHNNQSVFSGCLWRFLSAGAAGEVREFLRSAVVPKLFEDGIRPALGGGRFFDGVTVAVFAESWQRVAHVQIRIGNTGFAENFDAVIHSATPRPAVFKHFERD